MRLNSRKSLWLRTPSGHSGQSQRQLVEFAQFQSQLPWIAHCRQFQFVQRSVVILPSCPSDCRGASGSSSKLSLVVEEREGVHHVCHSPLPSRKLFSDSNPMSSWEDSRSKISALRYWRFTSTNCFPSCKKIFVYSQ